MKHIFYTASIMLISFLSFATANAQTSATSSFSVQGRLTNLDGSAITNGLHTIVANIYQNGGANAIYTETDTATTTDGVFDIMLGANGRSKLNLSATGSYELGLSVDGGAQLMPLLTIASVPIAASAKTADTAAVALAVGGNLIASLDSSLGSAVVTTVNGAHGNVTINGGGNLAVTSNGNNINLSFTDTGSGGLNLPFSQISSSASGLFNLTNSGAGAAEMLTSTGTGNALQLTASNGSALSASTNGSSPALDITNTGGAAISATGSSANGATLQLQNTASASSAGLISALNSEGGTAFSVAATGATNIQSSVANALSVTSTVGAAINATSSSANGTTLQLQNTASDSAAGLISALNSSGKAAFSVAANGATTIVSSGATALTDSVTSTGGTAIRIAGGLSISGPVGSGTISAGNLTATISNAFAKAGSMIFLTVNSTLSSLVPIRITGTSAGSFTVGLLSALALTSDLSFNYLIVNQ